MVKHKTKSHKLKKQRQIDEPGSRKLKISTNPWQVSTVALGVLLIASVVMSGFSTGVVAGPTEQGFITITSQDAADKAIKFINQNLLQGETATLKGVEESGNVYNVKLNINGQEFNSYVTKDGKLLFPNAINLDETPEIPQQPQAQQAQDMPKTTTPDVKLFTMSFCPYGNQAEEAMHPVVEALGDSVEVEPHYVIYSNYRGGGPQYCLDEENKYCSMHGIQELNQNIRELCVYKYQKNKFWDFVMEINEKCSSQNVDSCWETIAKEQGIDTEKIKTCQKDEAITLLKREVELNEKYGVRGSPTLVINDVTYNGGRTPEAYKQGICSAFTTEPDGCSESLGSAAVSSPAGGCG